MNRIKVFTAVPEPQLGLDLTDDQLTSAQEPNYTSPVDLHGIQIRIGKMIVAVDRVDIALNTRGKETGEVTLHTRVLTLQK